MPTRPSRVPPEVYQLGPTAQLMELNRRTAAQELLAMIPADEPEEE
jgi:hypothetical protein